MKMPPPFSDTREVICAPGTPVDVESRVFMKHIYWVYCELPDAWRLMERYEKRTKEP